MYLYVLSANCIDSCLVWAHFNETLTQIHTNLDDELVGYKNFAIIIFSLK